MSIVIFVALFIIPHNGISQNKILYSFGDSLNLEIDKAIKEYAEKFKAGLPIEVCIVLRTLDTSKVITITQYGKGFSENIGSNRIYINSSKREVPIFFDYDLKYRVLVETKDGAFVITFTVGGYNLIIDDDGRIVTKYYSQ